MTRIMAVIERNLLTRAWVAVLPLVALGVADALLLYHAMYAFPASVITLAMIMAVGWFITALFAASCWFNVVVSNKKLSSSKN
jgi:hypothetical protein